jgi:hypothetical protein
MRWLKACLVVVGVLAAIGWVEAGPALGDVGLPAYSGPYFLTSARMATSGSPSTTPANTVLLFGDPFFDPADRQADRGGYDQYRSGALGKRRSFGDDPRVRSFCHHHDPVCQASRQPGAFLNW